MSSTKFQEEHILQQIERKAHAAVTLRRFVKIDATDHDECAPAGANEAALGVALNSADPAKSVVVATQGIVMIDAGDTIVVNDELISDASGKAVPRGVAIAMVTTVRARALTAAASGEQVCALLTNYGVDALPHIGTESTPFTMTSAAKFGQVYVRSNAASGTARGLYIRHHFAGGCGGEALRAYGTVEAAAPVDTCNGAHISLDFGLTAGTGNCTGQANAGRFTLHLPTGRTIGGTISVVRAEAWADGAAPNVSNFAFFTAESGGDGTGAAVIDTKANLLRIVSPPVNGSMVEAGTGMGTVEGTLRIMLNGAAKYLPYYAAPG